MLVGKGGRAALTVYTIIAMSHHYYGAAPLTHFWLRSPPLGPSSAKKLDFVGSSGFTCGSPFHVRGRSLSSLEYDDGKVTSGQTLPNPRRASNYRLLWLAPMNSALSEGMKGRTGDGMATRDPWDGSTQGHYWTLAFFTSWSILSSLLGKY